jgi:Tol biopolymer transport system component
MALAAGTRLGAYEITGPLGAGGMGEVYRARDTQLGRDVAIKVLPASFTSDANRVARFEQEAKTLAALNHPNIAHIYGLERGEGTTGLVMEVVEGPTLAERIEQGRVPVDEALGIATQIADALEAAHERGIVHRDLKPANIKLKPDGMVKVLDFGIAKALDTRAISGAPPPALMTPAETQAGMVLGTAAYMSPEQAKGKPVDQRTDVWAFGCVLYEMLTGEPAFLGEDITSTLARVLERPVKLAALPARVPPAVRRTLELCLAKDVRARLADLRDVKLALAGAFALAPVAPPLWRRALPSVATLVLGVVVTAAYLLSVAPTVPPRADVAAPMPVTRFVITPPPTAPLTSQGGLDLAISPDGKRIAYLAQKDDSHNEVYVRELDALEARALPGTEEQNQVNRNLFFSADGKSIGYQGAAGIMSVAIDGRPSVKLADPPATGFNGGEWTADNQLYYSAVTQLWRVSTSGGGTPEPLGAAREAGVGGVAGPLLLPGGRAVVFHAYGGTEGDRVVGLDLDTGEEKTLVEGGSNPAYLDSGHLVFVRGTTLMAVPFDAAELAVTGEPVALVQGVRRLAGGAADYALSANGTLAYVPAGEEGQGAPRPVVWVDRRGVTLGRAVPDLVDNPREPHVSPDGKRLLLVTGPLRDGDLWVYDLSGRPPIPLALPGNNGTPVWSPDGKQAAFFSDGRIVRLPADGSMRVPQTVGDYGAVGPRSWSAAGDLIINRVPGDILAVSATAGGEPRPIVATESAEFDPALSPNGRWLAYTSNRTGAPEIWVQAYPEGVPVRVSSSGGFDPLWSCDGRELFYQRANATMAVSVESGGSEFSFGTPQELFAGSYYRLPAAAVGTYDVAADGRFVMIASGDDRNAPESASIVVV